MYDVGVRIAVSVIRYAVFLFRKHGLSVSACVETAAAETKTPRAMITAGSEFLRCASAKVNIQERGGKVHILAL